MDSGHFGSTYRASTLTVPPNLRSSNTHLLENQDDRFCWKWTSDKTFSTASAYLAFFNGQHPIEGAKVLRKTCAPGKCKFFIWLVLHDRCWTVARRKRHGLQDDDLCVLCAQSSETIDHLLTTCPFSREVWFKILHKIGWDRVTPSTLTFNFPSWWTDAREQIPKVGRRGFDSLVILVCWIIWKECNDRTFDHCVRTIDDIVLRVLDEIKAWSLTGFRHLEAAFPVLGLPSGRELLAG